MDNTILKLSDVMKKKEEKLSFLVENPRFKDFTDSFEEVEDKGNWIVNNLKRKNLEIDRPVEYKEDGVFNFYVFKSGKSQKAIQNAYCKFFGPDPEVKKPIKRVINFFKSIPYFIDDMKAKREIFKLDKITKNESNREMYADSAQVLGQYNLNKTGDKRFQRFLRRFNVKTINYKPPKSE